MDVTPLTRDPAQIARLKPFALTPPVPSNGDEGDEKEVRQAFQSFVGQTFFGQLLKAMRKTVGKPAYLDGGRAEEIFQQQLDQVLAEKISDACADQFAGPMYDLFALKRT